MISKIQNESIKQYLFQNNSLVMAVASLDMKILAMNEAGLSFFKTAENQIIGKSILELNEHSSVAFDFERITKLLNNEISSYIIDRRYIVNGEVYDAYLIVSLIEVEKQKFFSGVLIEENNIKEIIKLKKEDDYDILTSILSTSQDLHYIMDFQKKEYVYINKDILNFFGYEVSDLSLNQSKWQFLKSKLVDSSTIVWSKGKSKLSEVNQKGEYIDVEYKLLCKNGNYKWIRERSTPLSFGLDNQIKICYTILQDITEKREFFEKNVEQQLLIEKIAGITPDIIFVYELLTHKNVYNNFAGRKFLGYSEFEWSINGLNYIPPSEQKKLQNHFDKLKKIDVNEYVEDEFKLVSKDGKERWVLVKSKIFKFDEIGTSIEALSLISDVTELKQAVLNAKKSEKTQIAILEAIPDLILKVSKEGIYLQVIPSNNNDGYNPRIDKMLGKSIFDVLPKQTADILFQNLQKSIDDQIVVSFEIEREIDSKYYFLENHISPISKSEAIIVVRNISSKKKMQQTVEEKVIELSNKNDELEKYITKNRELERFAYIVSHDLKEPLRTIKSFAEIISKSYLDNLDDNAKEYFNYISSNTTRMYALIEGILEYSKIEDSHVQLDIVNVGKEINEIFEDLQGVITQTNAQFIINSIHSVHGNKVQIRQLFQNLISNALKFIPNDRTPNIQIDSFENDKNIIFSIKDNGIGIQSENFNKIFDMFKRLHTRDTYSGHGVGLAICKKIVEAHHGEIWVESDGANGTTFFISFPKR
jgi:two-component system CheB/CheR fusion protein